MVIIIIIVAIRCILLLIAENRALLEKQVKCGKTDTHIVLTILFVYKSTLAENEDLKLDLWL